MNFKNIKTSGILFIIVLLIIIKSARDNTQLEPGNL